MAVPGLQGRKHERWTHTLGFHVYGAQVEVGPVDVDVPHTVAFELRVLTLQEGDARAQRADC